MTWIDTSADWTRPGDEDYYVKNTVDLSAYDLLVAVGPTVDMGGWKLYGGPFFYMVNGDVDVEHLDIPIDEGDTLWWKGSADVEEDNSFGAYVGAAIPLAEKVDITFEVAAISGGWGLGTGITLKF